MAGEGASKKRKQASTSSTSPTPSSSRTYAVDEKVWAHDGGRLYEAKVLKVDAKEGADTQYFLHYLGWNAKWDKWVSGEGLVPDGKEAQDLAKKLQAPKKSVVAKKGLVDKKAGGVARKKPRMDVKKDIEDDSGVLQVKLAIPFTLKKQLVTDWEFVTQEPKLLVPLPRKVTVAEIMNDFMAGKKKDDSGDGGAATEGSKGGKRGGGGGSASAQNVARFQELLDGLKIYFDKALPLILLYRQERSQYEKLISHYPGKQPSELYGAEHLLRLFVKLPTLLAQTALSSQEITQVQSKIGEFMRFIQKGHAQYFLQQYEPEDLAVEDA